MTDPSLPSPGQLLRTATLTVAWLVVLPCLVLVLSVFMPVVPWLRIYAATIVPKFAFWMFTLALVALLTTMTFHASRKTAVSRALIGGSSVATLLAGVVVVRLLFLAQMNDVKIDLIGALGMRATIDDGVPDQTHVFARAGDEALKLDVYQPRGLPAGTRSPVMIAVHGGGFSEGSRSYGSSNMRWFADRGWTVISVDYRLARPNRPTWNLAAADVGCALVWTAAHADALRIDLNRVTVTGGSAGGTLAMTVAFATNAGQPVSGCRGRMPHVAAVVAKVPLIDPIAAWRHQGEMQALQQQYLAMYLGGAPDRFPGRYAAVDLRNQLWRSNPPTLILGGSQDALIPAQTAMDFTQAATDRGLQVRHVLFPYSGHDFNTRYDSITNQTVLQLVANFMTEHGAGPTSRRQG